MESLSTDDTRECPPLGVIGARESVATVSLYRVEPDTALLSPGSLDHLRGLVHTFERRSVFSRMMTRRQVAAVLSRPPVRTLLPCWHHYLHVTLCHVTHCTRHVVVEQVPSEVGLKIIRDIKFRVDSRRRRSRLRRQDCVNRDLAGLVGEWRTRARCSGNGDDEWLRPRATETTWACVTNTHTPARARVRACVLHRPKLIQVPVGETAMKQDQKDTNIEDQYWWHHSRACWRC